MAQKKQSTDTVTVEQEKSALDCCLEQGVSKQNNRLAKRTITLTVQPQTYCCGVWQDEGEAQQRTVTLNASGGFEMKVTIGADKFRISGSIK